MTLPPHKRPSALKEPSIRKQPVAGPVPQWGQMRPAWRISRLEMCDPFGWHLVDETTLDMIRKKLQAFESMTINQLFVEARYLNHSVSRDKLCPDARKRLTELRLECDELHSLHLTGAKRVWGILSENVITLLWWDPDHKVCPAPKKHT